MIYVGTTSKSLAAALRVGWLVVPAQLTGVVGDTIRVINAWPCSLEQLALARFIESGMFDRHIRRMRGLYRKRRDLLAAALASCAPVLQITGIAAGGHGLVRMPPGRPGEHEVITMVARAGFALDGLSGYRARDPAAEPLGPALVTARAARQQQWEDAHPDLASLAEQVQRLSGEVERLRDRLRQHGIEPEDKTP